MSTDRELLELAAKAAGMGTLNFDYAKREGHCFYFGPRLPMPQGVLMAAMHTYWNPLTDDGDALRLAVRLRIQVEQWPDEDGKGEYCSCGDAIIEDHGEDDLAATRRAIVRAAAEIGRAMP